MAGASFVLGLLFNYFFYKQLPGVAFPLFASAVLIILFSLEIYFKIKFHAANFYITLGILFFSWMVFVRANSFLVFLNIVITIYLFYLITDQNAKKNIKKYLLVDYIKLIISLSGKFINGAIFALSELVTLKSEMGEQKKLSQIIKGALMAIPVLFLFILLFSSADLVFQKYLQDIINYFGIEFLTQTLIVLIMTLGFMGVFTYMFYKPAILEDRGEPIIKRSGLGALETTIFLGAINLLFLLFIILQLTYLFGGENNVTGQGFTYAEYARQGFFELLVVSITSFLLVWNSQKNIAAENNNTPVQFKVVSTFLSIEVLIIMASAFKRLLLYENAFGFTTARFYGHLAVIWLGLIFLFLIYKILANKKESMFAFVSFISIIAFLAFVNIFNPDAFIGRKNIERASSNNLDVYYITSLSEDGMEQSIKALDMPDEHLRRTAARNLYFKKQNLDRILSGTGWQSTNLSRRKALRIFESKNSILEENKDYGITEPSY